MGDALWIPTEVALDSLGEWAEESNLDLGVVTVGEVIQEAGTREALDPVKGEVPGTGPPWDALAPELGEVRCSVSTLLQLEQANAWADLVGLETSGQKALGPRWLTLLSAASTYGSGAGEPEALAGISDVARGVRAACESDLTCVCQALSECVTTAYGPSGSIPVVVYNTLSWNRSGPVRVHATLYGDAVATDSSRYETYRLEDDEGRPVTSQELTGRHTNASEVDLLFVASDVPGGGYRTYYLVPKAPASDPFVGIQAPGSAAPEFPEPAFVVEDVTDQVSRPYRGVRTGRRFRSRYHDLDVNEVTGRVSIADRHLDRDLLRDIRLVAVEESMDAGPAGHSPTGRTHELVPERIELEESGEVRAVLAVSGRLLSSLATIRYRFYEQVPWVDVILNLKWVDEVPARVQMMFPVCATAPQVHYGVPYGHVGLESWAASDEIQGGDGDAAAYHGGNCEGWVAADSDGWGVVLATDRRTFGLAGSVLRNEVLLSCPDPASFGYKRIWRTYPETVTGCFRIRGYDRGFAEGLAHRDGWECTHGMRTSCSYGPSDGRRLPARQSLLRLDAPGLVTSALKQAEDGEALVLRVFETLGKDTVAKLTSLRPILSVSEADMLERAGADQDPVRIPFRPFEIKTLRIQLGAAE